MISMSFYITKIANTLIAQSEVSSKTFEDLVEDFSKKILKKIPTESGKFYQDGAHVRQYPNRPLFSLKWVLQPLKKFEKETHISQFITFQDWVIKQLSKIIKSAYYSNVQTDEEFKKEKFKESLDIVMDFLKMTGNLKAEDLKAIRDFAFRAKDSISSSRFHL